MAVAQSFEFSAAHGTSSVKTGSLRDRLRLHNHSYSGADIRAIIHVEPFEDENGKQQTTLELATLQTLSYSVFRDTAPVRTLGTVYEKSRTKGPRTIAGTMIFTVFDEGVLNKILRVPNKEFDRASPMSGNSLRYMMIDQLPPMDITVNFINEYGFGSRMALLGVELASEGQVMSIEDMLTESTVQFTARNMMFMHALGKNTTDDVDPAIARGVPPQVTFDSIVAGRTGMRKSDISHLLKRSRNPFI